MDPEILEFWRVWITLILQGDVFLETQPYFMGVQPWH